MKRLSFYLLITVALLALAACSNQQEPPPTPTRTPLATIESIQPVEETEASTEPAPLPESAPTRTPLPTPVGPFGPTDFPLNVNPLTGEVVDDPDVLDRRPLLIKISNNPEIVRPQSGLMQADHVWEHVTEGFALTRFTAVFLGEAPDKVGSVRSGRPPDLELVPMYGGLFFCSGFSSNLYPGGPPRMREIMRAEPWFKRNFCADYGYAEPYWDRYPEEGLASEHTLFAHPDELWNLADELEVNDRLPLEGFYFNEEPPAGGTPTAEVMIDYPGQGPVVEWRWSDSKGKWLRWTDGKVHEDKIADEQINADNVVIVYAPHYELDFIEDEAAQLKAVYAELWGEGPAVLMRDGVRYDATWKREDSESENMIQFFDASGEVIAFKPGNTFFQLCSNGWFPPEIEFK